MAKKAKLGKGLGSLIQSTSLDSLKETANMVNNSAVAAEIKKEEVAPAKKEEVEGMPAMVSIAEVHANPNQPRKIFKEKELEELSLSIKENGVIQPIIVVKADKGFEVIAGERRLRASKMAGLEEIPVIVKRATDREKTVMAIIENVQRSDLNCVEEALAYYQLMDEYKLTQEEVAKKIGKERSTIANFLRILKLPREVVELIQMDKLSFGHAKVLAAVKDRDLAIRSAHIAVNESLSVRELEKLLKKKKSVGAKDPSGSFFDEQLDEFKQKLEKTTGFHFGIKSKPNGAGQLTIKFSNEAEFNDIYEYLLKR